jgi:DNA-binding NtrC family response regulator
MTSVNGPRVLVVDDEQAQAIFLTEALEMYDYRAEGVTSAVEALVRLRGGAYDVLITDLKMPEMSGLELLQQALQIRPGLSVIVVTAHGTVETAVEAMKLGAEDYLRKPVELVELQLVLRRIREKRQLVEENRELAEANRSLRRDLAIQYHFTNTLGGSGIALGLLKQVQDQLEARRPTLIMGEPGSGLEDIARMIHYNGPRAESSLSYFDCSSVPSQLHASHLFGQGQPAGLLSRPGGSVVVSELKYLDSSCHAPLIQFLEDARAAGPGSVRLLVTEVMNQHEIPRDLFGAPKLHQLLMQNVIRVPPLRARKGDIPAMAVAIARRVGMALGKRIERIDAEALQKLSSYDFPGNHRELESMVESACFRCAGDALQTADFKFTPFDRPW